MYINLFDSHVHSDNSFDAAHSLTFLCEKAVEQGVSGIAVTDHCELRDYHRDHYAQRLAQAAFDVRKCRAVFRGQLSLLFGVELSDLFYDEALAARVNPADVTPESPSGADAAAGPAVDADTDFETDANPEFADSDFGIFDVAKAQSELEQDARAIVDKVAGAAKDES